MALIVCTPRSLNFAALDLAIPGSLLCLHELTITMMLGDGTRFGVDNLLVFLELFR